MGLSDALAEAVGPREPMGGPMYTPHEVRITRPFYIGAFEVTNAQYEQFDPQHARRRPDYQRGAAGDNHPVDPVTWQDAQRFCRWLSQCEGRVYRLPTEAEWEYACRAGTTNRTYWGDDSHDRTKANLGYGVKAKRLRFAEDGFEFTAPVGSFPPNPWGLYDMIGNAWEWAQDWYRPGTNAPAVDPRGPPTGHCRVAKGGGWNTSLWSVSSALRDGDDPDDLKDARGFRVVCETADAPP
jgi:formylglycine-generating enzyme required for sulfatase activity